jgi:hypothetical protein
VHVYACILRCVHDIAKHSAIQGLSQKRLVRVVVFDYDNAGNREYLFSLSSGGCEKLRAAGCLMGRTYDEYPERVVIRAVPNRASCIAWAEEFGKSLQVRRLRWSDADFAAAAELCSAWTGEAPVPTHTDLTV